GGALGPAWRVAVALRRDQPAGGAVGDQLREPGGPRLLPLGVVEPVGRRPAVRRRGRLPERERRRVRRERGRLLGGEVHAPLLVAVDAGAVGPTPLVGGDPRRVHAALRQQPLDVGDVDRAPRRAGLARRPPLPAPARGGGGRARAWGTAPAWARWRGRGAPPARRGPPPGR